MVDNAAVAVAGAVNVLRGNISSYVMIRPRRHSQH